MSWLLRSYWGRYTLFAVGICTVPAALIYGANYDENREEKLHEELRRKHPDRVRQAKKQNAKIRELWAAQQRGDPEVEAKYEAILKGGKNS